MDEELKKRRADINKKTKLTKFLMVFLWLGAMSILATGADQTLLMIEVMLIMLRVELLERELLLFFGKTVMTMLPATIYLVGDRKLSELKGESKKLRSEEMKYLRKKKFEEEKEKVQELLETAQKLSRKEQMQLLNTVKDELTKMEKAYKTEIKSTDEYSLCYVQKELEDILFPSVVDGVKDYTRAKKK